MDEGSVRKEKDGKSRVAHDPLNYMSETGDLSPAFGTLTLNRLVASGALLYYIPYQQ